MAEEAAKYDTQLDKMKEIAWKLNETHVATVETNKKKVVGWVKALTDCADWVQIRALVLELLELIHETLQLDLEVPGTLRRPMDADMRAVCQPLAEAFRSRVFFPEENVGLTAIRAW